MIAQLLETITKLNATEKGTLLSHLIRTVAAEQDPEAVRQAIIAAFYPAPGQTMVAAPEWLETLVQDETTTSEDDTVAEEYLNAVRKRLQTKYGDST